MNSYVNTHYLALRAGCFCRDPNATLTKNAHVARSVSNPSPKDREVTTTLRTSKNTSPMDLRAGTFRTNLNWKMQMGQWQWLHIINEDNLMDIVCPFSVWQDLTVTYCFAYSGGDHKSLRSHFFFWDRLGDSGKSDACQFMQCSVVTWL